MLNVVPYGHIKTLHVGTGRGVTIYDPDEDVCWLLAFDETHAVGERRDGYARFERLSQRDELLPSDADQELLEEITELAVLDELRAAGQQLYDEARAQPGQEVSNTFRSTRHKQGSVEIVVDLVIDGAEEAEQGWLCIAVPPETTLSMDQLLDVLAALLPEDVDADSLEQAYDFHGRTIAYNELAWTWSRYVDG
ncbi:hypothetical protein [Agrococcus sp. Marseille-Q4369]|uniref:hypothetical protein n=1 Tax=Agrococcus sp. Marseille-Q4369 TaxID=2810513 RepID=UPI001B8B3FA3|nr:hypothetical protein [Agrococcus sp. Marseille-Q4369]QUW18041.1 hypothetical protein JSQ78_09295 [Agrococcus sp. Marseille-Q4369]